MKNKGFTILELMIVIAVFGVISFAVMAVTRITSKELAVTIPESDIQTNAQRAVQRLKETLVEASTSQVTIGPGGKWVRFVVPVDPLAKGGDPLKPDYSISWGARTMDGTTEKPGGVVAFDFQMVENVDEATLKLNVNRNTELVRDTKDVFARGYLVYVYDPDASFPVMSGDERIKHVTGPWVVQVSSGGTYGGDVDGDGNPDPLFTVSGNTVSLSLWVLQVIRTENMPLLMNLRTNVSMRNQ